MMWKYNKGLKRKGEILIEEGEKVSNKGNWFWYQKSSEQFKEGLRVKLVFENDITHLQFEKSKGDYFVTVCPDHNKKNQVISIHRITTSGSQKNFIKGKGIFKKVHFYPNKPQILILTSLSVIMFSLVKLQKIKQLTVGGATSFCMGVHPTGEHIIVGTQSHKVLDIFMIVAVL